MRLCHSNILLRHPLLVPVLLVTIIFAVYYPVLLSGIHPIDDPGIFAFYSSSPPLSTIFLPGHDFYYRPVVGLSYYFDNWLWGMESGPMHLENVLLHCANTLLVYLLALRISCEEENPVIPLLVALLFALHPVNVESIAWIAGRTDPLLALFVLLASYYWLRWLEKPRWQDLITALLLFSVALLTKETALAFGAVVLLFTLKWPGAATNRQRLKAVCIIIAPCVLLVILALLFRSGSIGISRFMSGTDLPIAQGIWKALVAFGFYFKKLIFPFPLNFAINTVHPAFGILGVALFPALWFAFRRNRLSGILIMSAALFILPAILVAVKQIAWTPYAERYLYLPTAFLALALVGIEKTWGRKYSIVRMSLIVLVLCRLALGSFQRNLLWNDPFSFFQDAVIKSPEFGSVYYSLGGELIKKGEIDRAAEAFTTADRLNQRVSMRNAIKLSIMGTMLAGSKYTEARAYFFQLFIKKTDAPPNFLELLYKADNRQLDTIKDEDKILLAKDLLETLEILNVKKPDPFWLYRSGQIAIVIGNTAKAADFFRRAYAAAPVDAHFKAAAQTYFLRLEAGK